MMCIGMLPGTAFAADGSTEVAGVETSDGKFLIPMMKAGRSYGDKPAASVADLAYPFDAFGNWDSYTAYAGISKQAETFISYAQAMEGAMAEQDRMLKRVRELLAQAANGTNTEADIDAEFAEINQLRQEWARLCDDTYGECPEEGTGWYGLCGGSVEFGLPWAVSGDGPLLRLELPDMREMFTEQVVSEMRSDMEHGLEIVGSIETELVECRAVMGAKLNMADCLYGFAKAASENQASNRFGTGPFDTLGPDTYDFPDTDPERIFMSSMANAIDLIAFVQLAEGSLASIHSIEQRIKELQVKMLNGDDATEMEGARAEIVELNRCIRYVMNAVSYDGFHFLSEPGKTVTCPLGWKDLCHHEIKLRYDQTWTLGDDPSLEEINVAINSVSLVDDDGAGHGIEANGMPVRLVSQSNEVMLGYSAMDAAEFEALIGGAGGDGLPRFAGAENVDVKAIEESGVFPDLDNTSENTQDAESNIRDTDVATDIVGDNARGMVIQQNMRPGFSYSDPFLRTASVYNYGFDIAKLDESGKLLQGGTFDVRTGPEDGASAMEFVPVEWMDGSNNEAVFPEGPVYRIAVDGDDPEVRTAEIEAGKAIVVGLDSGTYYVAEKKAPSGYLRDAEPHSVRLLSLSDFMAGLRADYAEEMVEFSKDNILAQVGQAMLGQANQVPDGTYTVVYKAVDGSRTEGLATNADLPWTELCRDEDVAFLDEVSWGGVKERHGLEDPAPYVLDGETYTWQGTWKSSWNDGLTVRTYEAVYGTGPVSAKNLERLSSGYRVNRAGDDAAGLAISEKMRSQINGKRQAWCNMIPIQVDGGGIYDLSDLGIKEKVFSGMALFDKTDDGEYKYGNTSLTLQVGANVDQKLQGTPEAPLKGGLPVTNLPGLELPKTGGAGTVPYIIFGSMMVLLSGLLLADRKRHRYCPSM